MTARTPPARRTPDGALWCVDVGSTFTKVVAVEPLTGRLLGSAAHPTTVTTDVLRGLDAAVARLGGPSSTPEADDSTMFVCSSAGGGLRLAVVGYERLVTAEAGHRVALSAGGRVVHVAAGRLDRTGVEDLRATRPDVVLLVGGTDGGDAEVLAHNAARLGVARLRVPVVLAGNADAAGVAAASLAAGANGAGRALRILRDADQCAEFHQRLVQVRTRVGDSGRKVGRRCHQFRGEGPELFIRRGFTRVFRDAMDAREHTDDIAIEDGCRLVVGDAAYGSGGVAADAG